MILVNDQPTDIQFNAAIQTMARIILPVGYDVAKTYAEAPMTLAQSQCIVALTGRILVTDQDGEHTIFADKEVNADFRAWHDAVHIRHGFQFTLAGEAATCFVQISDLIKKYGRGERTKKWITYILAEVIGMANYFDKQHKFPDDMRDFTEKTCAQWDEAAEHFMWLIKDDNSAKSLAYILYGNPYDISGST